MTFGHPAEARKSPSQHTASWSAATLPPPVQKIADGYARQCRELGGRLSAKAGRPAIMTADLDGDSLQDFVLSPQSMTCSGAATAFCANAGCEIKIALSRDGYARPVSITGGQPTIALTEAGASLEIWVDRTRCNSDDRVQACWATYRWRGGKASTDYVTRPVAEAAKPSANQ